MAQAVNTYPDPGITVGPYRVLPSTRGGFILYDERLPPGARTAGSAQTKDEAIAEANRLVGLGAPMVSVTTSPRAPVASNGNRSAR